MFSRYDELPGSSADDYIIDPDYTTEAYLGQIKATLVAFGYPSAFQAISVHFLETLSWAVRIWVSVNRTFLPSTLNPFLLKISLASSDSKHIPVFSRISRVAACTR